MSSRSRHVSRSVYIHSNAAWWQTNDDCTNFYLSWYSSLNPQSKMQKVCYRFPLKIISSLYCTFSRICLRIFVLFHDGIQEPAAEKSNKSDDSPTSSETSPTVHRVMPNKVRNYLHEVMIQTFKTSANVDAKRSKLYASFFLVSLHLTKQLRSCKNQWNSWITSIRIPSSEVF